MSLFKYGIIFKYYFHLIILQDSLFLEIVHPFYQPVRWDNSRVGLNFW